MEFIFSEQDEQAIVAAIQEAERQTSGEIRLHVEPQCKAETETTELDPFERALAVFAELGMHRTKLQNGVLFYLAYESHKFAIVADAGINNKVAEDFWEQIKDNMAAQFQHGQFVQGLREGILAAGQQLKTFFPVTDHNPDELDNTISKK